MLIGECGEKSVKSQTQLYERFRSAGMNTMNYRNYLPQIFMFYFLCRLLLLLLFFIDDLVRVFKNRCRGTKVRHFIYIYIAISRSTKAKK